MQNPILAVLAAGGLTGAVIAQAASAAGADCGDPLPRTILVLVASYGAGRMAGDGAAAVLALRFPTVKESRVSVAAGWVVAGIAAVYLLGRGVT